MYKIVHAEPDRRMAGQKISRTCGTLPPEQLAPRVEHFLLPQSRLLPRRLASAAASGVSSWCHECIGLDTQPALSVPRLTRAHVRSPARRCARQAVWPMAAVDSGRVKSCICAQSGPQKEPTTSLQSGPGIGSIFCAALMKQRRVSKRVKTRGHWQKPSPCNRQGVASACRATFRRIWAPFYNSRSIQYHPHLKNRPGGGGFKLRCAHR